MTEERFMELWDELTFQQKLQCHQEYCANHNMDDMISSFDEQFFEDIYGDCDKMRIVRHICFGDVDWDDGYIRYDGYGNLKSLSEREALEEIDDAASYIYEHPEIWKHYINEDEEEDSEDEE
jgi:hypothetical protein